MYSVELPKEKLIELVGKHIDEMMEDNRENFNKAKQIMTPMSCQIAVLATIQTLHDLGLININEPNKSEQTTMS